ncbi:polysaccharide biosynthesis/export family protein [Parafilimonas sp.]|uniref:polysaccharide biosynthesis/export family protein n=1 Tax=Parafilimonas sp. TaxID=1969739 RepID=UPI003F7CF1D2
MLSYFKNLIPLLACIIFMAVFSSCGVPKNFQNAVYLKDSVTDSERMVLQKPVVIMPGDRLNINITAINKEAADAFNITQGAATQGVQGYLVDAAGNIQMLQLGTMPVAGLAPAQLQQQLQKQLDDYIKGSVVTVNIANFKVMVMGEVGSPGTLQVPDGKINILQAITQSGDLTLYAKRDNILVIREQNGKREFGRVDISSNKIFTSPYYNLQQNDVIYVEPDKAKFINNDAFLNRNVRYLGLAMTALSAALLIVNVINR